MVVERWHLGSGSGCGVDVIVMLSKPCWFNDFGVDGGPAAKELIPRFTAVQKHLTSNLGFRLPDIDVDQVERSPLILTYIVLLAQVKLLHLAFSTPVPCDFCKYDMSQPEFFRLLNVFVQVMSTFDKPLAVSVRWIAFPPGNEEFDSKEATQEEGS
ncbi:hypothetical protein Ancab_030260 [Ancistrocladus abbreviatus]